MALRLALTHNEQRVRDERESTWLFLNSVSRLAKRDECLTREESTALISSVQEAEEQAGVGTEDKEVYMSIALELDIVVEQVDTVVDNYSKDLDRIIERNDPEAMSQSFQQVGEHLFRKGITTMRIFVLLRFGYKLVQRFFLNLKRGMDQCLGTEVSDFILLVGTFLFKAFLKNHVMPWVREHGGWQRVLSSVNWGALAVCAGVVLIGLGLWKLFSRTIDN